MWSKLNGLFKMLISKLSKLNSIEVVTTWVSLEMQHKSNLENLEDLKKLRIKNF